MIPAMAVARVVENRLVSAKVCLEIIEVIQPPKPADSTHEMDYPGVIADPLGSRRSALAQIARLLADAARQLDAQQPRGLPPHPISTLLRAASLSVRRFLGNQRSLHMPIPEDLTELLKTTLALFAAHRDQTAYQRLAEQAAAFDEHGDPAVDLIGNPPSRFVAFASRTVTSIPKIAIVITSIATITAIIIAVTLALLHRMNITDLLQYLK
jgi:hypothetical protein